MKVIISNNSDVSLYQQIKDQIKDAIFKEELKASRDKTIIIDVKDGKLTFGN